MCKHGTTLPTRICKGLDAAIVDIDYCIQPLVVGLNNAGFETVASCCGHGQRPGNIALADGRELIIAPDFATARQIDALFSKDIHGAGKGSPYHEIEAEFDGELQQFVAVAGPAQEAMQDDDTPATTPEARYWRAHYFAAISQRDSARLLLAKEARRSGPPKDGQETATAPKLRTLTLGDKSWQARDFRVVKGGLMSRNSGTEGPWSQVAQITANAKTIVALAELIANPAEGSE